MGSWSLLRRPAGLSTLEAALLRAVGARHGKCCGFRPPTAREVSQDARRALAEFERLHGLDDGRGS